MSCFQQNELVCLCIKAGGFVYRNVSNIYILILKMNLGKLKCQCPNCCLLAQLSSDQHFSSVWNTHSRNKKTGCTEQPEAGVITITIHMLQMGKLRLRKNKWIVHLGHNWQTRIWTPQSRFPTIIVKQLLQQLHQIEKEIYCVSSVGVCEANHRHGLVRHK